MKTLRIILWCLVPVFGLVAGYLYINQSSPGPQEIAVKLGGPFELVRHDGAPITHEALEGRNHAIFFGFTHCPDICPTTLYEASGWLKELGNDADNLDIYFVTVDPQRDTVEILKDYVGAFDPRIAGITGAPDKIGELVKSYKVYAKRVELEDGDYTVDHSAFVMLFDRERNFKGTIAYGENSETAIGKLRRLIGSG